MKTFCQNLWLICLLIGSTVIAQNPFSRLAQTPTDYSIVDDRDVPTRDIVHSDDVIINGGSLCVGFDCANGEAFGFDTIRLKENNLRIGFNDTSNTASFPTNDWEITINDSSNGGLDYFQIRDISGNLNPFRILAGAPSNSFYMLSSGNLGLGTATPVVELHITDGDTPTVRLEQNGSNGWTPQTWDVAGNETNFFVRDATNGSSLPFRIRPGSPTSAIDISPDGTVRIGGTTTNANASMVLVSNTKGLVLNRLDNTQRTTLGGLLGPLDSGMIVYDTDDLSAYAWDGTQWGAVGVDTDDQTADVFQLNGNNLELSLEDDGVATQTVDLSGYLDNTDDQVADVFQLNGNNLELSLEDDGVATQIVDLSGYLDNTDNQNISGSGFAANTLTIGISGGTSQNVDLSALDNPGTDDQQISLVTNSLNLEDGGSVDLSGYLDNTDNQNISGSGLAGDILTIGISGGTSEAVDLSVFNNSGTDDQQLTLTGNSLDLEDGGSVDLSGYLDNTDNQSITTFNLEGNLLKLQLENSNVVEVDLSSILIPLEVENASQQLQIDDLIARVEFLEACACQLPIDDIISDPNSPYLFQNIPNPYSDITSIRYYIPFEYNRAEIVLTTVTGQILTRIPVNKVGEGSVDFSRATLSSGIYLYTLYLDGKRIDTKRMLIE